MNYVYFAHTPELSIFARFNWKLSSKFWKLSPVDVVSHTFNSNYIAFQTSFTCLLFAHTQLNYFVLKLAHLKDDFSWKKNNFAKNVLQLRLFSHLVVPQEIIPHQHNTMGYFWYISTHSNEPNRNVKVFWCVVSSTTKEINPKQKCERLNKSIVFIKFSTGFFLILGPKNAIVGSWRCFGSAQWRESKWKYTVGTDHWHYLSATRSSKYP